MPNSTSQIEDATQRRVLWILLAINGVMFMVELAAGLLADSSGLIADSLDMLADATVYAIALYAVGRSPLLKAQVACLSGIIQIVLAGLVLFEVVRWSVVGSEPVSIVMIVVGGLALVANVACVVLILPHRTGEIHMRATWIFSRNDVLANLGVIAGGVLVAVSGSRLPDLVIGAMISALVLSGGIRIVKDAWREM